MTQLSLNGQGGHRWRGHPGLQTPYRQWIRENLPNSHDGFALCGDDGFACRWTRDDPIGWPCPIEVKTWRRKPTDTSTKKAFRALLQGRVARPLEINLVGGNTPGELREFPAPCPRCGLPEQPVVARTIILNNTVVTAPVLRRHFLEIGRYA